LYISISVSMNRYSRVPFVDVAISERTDAHASGLTLLRDGRSKSHDRMVVACFLRKSIKCFESKTQPPMRFERRSLVCVRSVWNKW
jgi:hypothetical protein